MRNKQGEPEKQLSKSLHYWIARKIGTTSLKVDGE